MSLIVFSVLSEVDDGGVLEHLWVFSEALEGVAMVPQYIFCYRDYTVDDLLVTAVVLLLGSYRVMYVVNWGYKKSLVPGYVDAVSWASGGIFLLCAERSCASSTSPNALLCATDRHPWSVCAIQLSEESYRILSQASSR